MTKQSLFLSPENKSWARWADEMRELAMTGDMPFKGYIIPNEAQPRWQESRTAFTLFFTYRFGTTEAHVVSSLFSANDPSCPWSIYVYHDAHTINEAQEKYVLLTDEQLVTRLASLINDSPIPETTNQPLNQLEQP